MQFAQLIKNNIIYFNYEKSVVAYGFFVYNSKYTSKIVLCILYYYVI
ncbi:hypothetical protein SAMN02194393_01614 [Maledivibacter halophilus]|uniref:Uncharacterized protein n=1 Tax=Maledivibacter halophilus TaxID=36842 RepID=A0A1T5K4K7_9FIRM|nr:hypothetical protein SAMN02194393_01614 [Maledivibacter halophilus]